MLKCLSALSEPISSLNRTTLMRSNRFRFGTTHIKLFTINYAMHPDHHLMYCVHYSVYPIQHIMDRGSMICWPPNVRIQTILNNSAMENKINFFSQQKWIKIIFLIFETLKINFWALFSKRVSIICCTPSIVCCTGVHHLLYSYPSSYGPGTS